MRIGDLLSPGRGVVEGEVRSGYVYPQGETRFPDIKSGEIVIPGTFSWRPEYEHNSVMYDWATIVAENLRNSPDGKNYAISGMYLEFENNGGAAVTPPSFDRSGGKSYYDGLLTDPNRDYLRVGMAGITLESTDLSLFPSGNKLNFIAQSTGVVGVHGKTFSDTVSSRVYGGALVATPVQADDTQDLVFSRFYFSNSANQLIKQAGSQITLTWPLTLQ